MRVQINMSFLVSIFQIYWNPHNEYLRRTHAALESLNPLRQQRLLLLPALSPGSLPYLIPLLPPLGPLAPPPSFRLCLPLPSCFAFPWSGCFMARMSGSVPRLAQDTRLCRWTRLTQVLQSVGAPGTRFMLLPPVLSPLITHSVKISL